MNHHTTMDVGARSSLCPRTIPKGSMTPNDHIIVISSRPLNHLVCVGFKAFLVFFNHLNHLKRPPWAKISPVG